MVKQRPAQPKTHTKEKESKGRHCQRPRASISSPNFAIPAQTLVPKHVAHGAGRRDPGLAGDVLGCPSLALKTQHPLLGNCVSPLYPSRRKPHKQPPAPQPPPQASPGCHSPSKRPSCPRISTEPCQGAGGPTQPASTTPRHGSNCVN